MGLVDLKELLTNEEGKLMGDGAIDFDCYPNNTLFTCKKGEIPWNTHAYFAHKYLLREIGEGEDITDEDVVKACEYISKIIVEVNNEEEAEAENFLLDIEGAILKSGV